MTKIIRPPLPLDASPQEKYDNLILTFFEEWQEYIGQDVLFKKLMQIRQSGNSNRRDSIYSTRLRQPSEISRLGFSRIEELILFLRAIIKDGLIIDLHSRGDVSKEFGMPSNLMLSYSGLKYCLSLLNSGKNSTRCFVAMAFKDDMECFYNEGIVKAIQTTGFHPVRVDKEHTENEQTINDFIIASIKQSKFCIADLTHQRNGVYFEAGYALGRGLKLIYTCRRDDHANVHFDLKTMQTILYDTAEELREALILKIQAFILD